MRVLSSADRLTVPTTVTPGPNSTGPLTMRDLQRSKEGGFDTRASIRSTSL